MARSPLLTVRISPELESDLASAIESSGLSKSEIVTQALRTFLKSDAPKSLVRGRPKSPDELKA